jgi:hypothetical protein
VQRPQIGGVELDSRLLNEMKRGVHLIGVRIGHRQIMGPIPTSRTRFDDRAVRVTRQRRHKPDIRRGAMIAPGRAFPLRSCDLAWDLRHRRHVNMRTDGFLRRISATSSSSRSSPQGCDVSDLSAAKLAARGWWVLPPWSRLRVGAGRELIWKAAEVDRPAGMRRCRGRRSSPGSPSRVASAR